jgi:hypothetical protein
VVSEQTGEFQSKRRAARSLLLLLTTPSALLGENTTLVPAAWSSEDRGVIWHLVATNQGTRGRWGGQGAQRQFLGHIRLLCPDISAERSLAGTAS